MVCLGTLVTDIHIVTAKHCLHNGQGHIYPKPQIKFHDQKKNYHRFILDEVYLHPILDFAIIQLQTAFFTDFRMHDSSKKTGLIFPYNGINWSLELDDFWEIGPQAFVTKPRWWVPYVLGPGKSGGGLLENGRLVGVLVGRGPYDDKGYSLTFIRFSWQIFEDLVDSLPQKLWKKKTLNH